MSANKPRKISQLKKNLRMKLEPASMKKDVIFNFCKRIGVCKGAHLEHVPKLILDARIGHKQILQRFSN